MLEKLSMIAVIGMLVLGNSACVQNDMSVNMENKAFYTEDEFVELKSGTPYDEVLKKYGGSDDGWGNLVYPLDDDRILHVSFSMNKEVLFLEIRQGNESTRFQKWEEREKSENSGKSDLRHPKSDFDSIKAGMSFDDVEEKLGYDYTLIGNGFIIAKYLTEDFDWVIIGCGQNNEVKNISFTSVL